MNALERQRLIDTLQSVGCLACRKRGFTGMPSDMHHPLTGGRRIDDDVFYPLCEYHHRNVQKGAYTLEMMRLTYGPSLACEPRKFREEFGTDTELLVERDRLLQLYRKMAP